MKSTALCPFPRLIPLLASVMIANLGGSPALADRYDYELSLAEEGRPSGSVSVEGDGSMAWTEVISGEVRNSLNEPLARASVVYRGREVMTDSRGAFVIDAGPQPANGVLMIKMPGYRKVVLSPRAGSLLVHLEPVEINSIYMQTGHMRRKTPVFRNAMNLLAETELNSLTIDVKDDEGRVSTGLKPYIDELHAQGYYAIARIVTFKDNNGPRKNPHLAVMNKTTGRPWEDKNGVTYLNPYNPAAWDYVIQIARDAVEAGFDEIQFDYVRFPTDGNRSLISWDMSKAPYLKKAEFTSESRTSAIAGFLARGRKELGAMGAFVAADVFGITAFDQNDSGIGQRIEQVAPHLDYVCPMVYPSGYAKGTGGVKDPVNQPGDIVEVSVRRYRVRAEKVNQELVIRPWLQSFRDYSYSKRDYTGTDIRAQIEGSNRGGGSGYLLWNAASKYQRAGLKEKKANRKVLP